MDRRVSVSVQVEGMSLEYRGGADLYEDLVRGMAESLARGGRRRVAAGPIRLAADPEDAGASPAAAPGPAPVLAAPAPPPPSPAAPSPSPSSPAPPPARAASAAGAPAFDATPLYAVLAREGGRRAEKDAVLLALVALAASGRRDASPAEITSHLEAGGFPAKGLKPRPILAKLGHRKGLVVPGVARGTFRATPAGVTYILRRARGR
jgi:hypothetical protein